MIVPISSDEFAQRRTEFQARLGDGVALIAGETLRRRSNDTDFPFRQNSDLFYLTGFDQPEAVAVFSATRFEFFVQPRNPEMETWNGRRPGVDGARELYGADESFDIERLSEKLPGLIENRSRLFHTFGLDQGLDTKVMAALADVRGRVRRGVIAPGAIFSPHDVLHEMRIRKSEAELALMREAADISLEAHQAAAKLCRAGAWEYELEAALLHVFRRRGGSGPAYSSIVGCGENGTILHYTENRDPLSTGKLVLIDAGAELQGYASDVTRTYPVDGEFTGAGRDVYQAVLDAQTAAIDTIRPGVKLPQIHEAAVRSLVGSLVDLKALEGELDELIEKEAYKPFYMHGTGHLLGMDVHDVGNYHVEGKPRPLEPGMCFTVEPGLYFSATSKETPEHLRGIGVRIEDNIVIGNDGFEILTAGIPKRIDELVAWMRE